MNFRVTLLQNLPDRTPLAVRARYRFRDGSVQTWPVAVNPEQGAAVLSVESGRDMLVPDALTRSLVAHYPTAPLQEERQISSVRPGEEVAPPDTAVDAHEPLAARRDSAQAGTGGPPGRAAYPPVAGEGGAHRTRPRS